MADTSAITGQKTVKQLQQIGFAANIPAGGFVVSNPIPFDRKTPDTTSISTNTTNGQITLSPNVQYRIHGFVEIAWTVGAANDVVQLQLFNVTAAANLVDDLGHTNSTTTYNNNNVTRLSESQRIDVLFTPTVTTVVEVRFATITGTLDNLRTRSQLTIETTKDFIPLVDTNFAKKDYAFIQLTPSQTTNIGNNLHVEFNLIQQPIGSDIVLTTGTGQANGLVTLLANKTYTVESNIQVGFSGLGFVDFAIWNVTNGVVLGSRNVDLANNRADNTSPNRQLKAVVRPATNIQIEIRVISASLATSYDTGRSYMFIEQIDEVVPVVRGPSYLRRTNGITKGSTNTNIIIYGTAAETVGGEITYQNSAANGDSFLINTSGTYAISVSSRSSAVDAILQISVGALNNSLAGPETRAINKDTGTTASDNISASWTGFVAAGQLIYTLNDQVVVGAVGENQITIARVG